MANSYLKLQLSIFLKTALDLFIQGELTKEKKDGIIDLYSGLIENCVNKHPEAFKKTSQLKEDL